jgi:hypothetical protein
MIIGHFYKYDVPTGLQEQTMVPIMPKANYSDVPTGLLEQTMVPIRP